MAARPPRLDDGRHAVELGLLQGDEDWSGAEVRGSLADWHAMRLEVSGCRLLACAFPGAFLDRSRIRDTRFEDCDLSGLVLAEANLTRVEFRNCRIAGLDSGGATLQDICFTQCKLEGASFRLSKGARVDFVECGLEASDFTSVKLEEARFLRCNLSGCEFSGAKLDGARLHGSILDNLRGAQSLRRVVIDSSQAIPLALCLLGASGIVVDDEE